MWLDVRKECEQETGMKTACNVHVVAKIYGIAGHMVIGLCAYPSVHMLVCEINIIAYREREGWE